MAKKKGPVPQDEGDTGAARFLRPFKDQPFDAAAATGEEAIAKTETHYRPPITGAPSGIVYGNAAARNVLAYVGKIADDHLFDGATVRADAARAAVGRLNAEMVKIGLKGEFSSAGPLARLRGAIKSALENEPPTVSFVDAGPGRSMADVKATIRHEFHHATETDWTPQAAQAFIDNTPVASRAAEMLKQHKGVKDNLVDLVSEIGAYLNGEPTQWTEFGLQTEAQAVALWSAWNKGALQALPRKWIHPKLKEGDKP